MTNSPTYPSRPASEVDPHGEFERAYAESAGVEWRCAGCGIPSPDRIRKCDCPTNVVVKGNTSAWKRAPYSADPKTVVDEQAEDEGLWFKAETITEDILQRALRRLHAAVEDWRLYEASSALMNRYAGGETPTAEEWGELQKALGWESPDV